VAEEAPPDGVTTALAYSASARALGGSIAVRLLPVLATAQAVGTAVSSALLILGMASLLIWTFTSLPWLHRRPMTTKKAKPGPGRADAQAMSSHWSGEH
jgi:hypothetical protein